jgi:hypothetical protein
VKEQWVLFTGLHLTLLWREHSVPFCFAVRGPTSYSKTATFCQLTLIVFEIVSFHFVVGSPFHFAAGKLLTI